MKHVTIYTSPTCHFCHQAMDYLKEKNVEFEAKDISKDPEARKFLMSQKIMGVPAIYIVRSSSPWPDPTAATAVMAATSS